MSSTTSDDPWQHLVDADRAPPIGPVSPADEYRLEQRIRRLRAQEQISTGVFSFVVLHVVSILACCMGVAIVAGMDDQFAKPISIVVVSLGWFVSMAAAMYVAWPAIAQFQQLRWTWLLYASVPWLVLCFEVFVILLPVLVNFV